MITHHLETHLARITPDVIRIMRYEGTKYKTFYVDIPNRKFHLVDERDSRSPMHGETFAWTQSDNDDGLITNTTYTVTENLSASTPYARHYFYESRGVKLHYELSLHLALNRVSKADEVLADYLQYVRRCLEVDNPESAFKVLDEQFKAMLDIVDNKHMKAMESFKCFQVS